MKGLKKHTRRDREKAVEEILPLVRRKFGDNLVALAAQGSFARGDDAAYSDLELIAFVKEMPGNEEWAGIGKIRDGLLVELVWMTRETYLKRTPEVNKDWFLSGSDVLLPIINERFVRELTDYRVENLSEKCLAEAKLRWHEVQEATGKVLNATAAAKAAAEKSRDAIPLLFADMLIHMLITLSFLNRTPYITFARFIEQARRFDTKPPSFENLLDIMTNGEFEDLARLEKTVETVFSQFEAIFEAFGVELYDDNINPDI